MNTNQIFNDFELKSDLKKYLQSAINKCDEEIKDYKVILTCDSEQITLSDRMDTHRKLEVIQYRRFWLYEQLDELCK